MSAVCGMHSAFHTRKDPDDRSIEKRMRESSHRRLPYSMRKQAICEMHHALHPMESRWQITRAANLQLASVTNRAFHRETNEREYIQSASQQSEAVTLPA
ncbi:Hypothetical predicted protein [Pelobates cultripes]|uniref:Uncharacterized protein n=1 Tax=Pelobates cultripes TaxID=61616 RepID=A0AAD1RDS0_PELCU|nr:Hypothetical predicted protein [Pelobates cultripes]